MSVPDYQSLMLPLLKVTADRNEHNLSEMTETLSQKFHLSDQDKKELLPSGKQRKFDPAPIC
jgi:restriction system protein